MPTPTPQEALSAVHTKLKELSAVLADYRKARDELIVRRPQRGNSFSAHRATSDNRLLRLAELRCFGFVEKLAGPHRDGSNVADMIETLLGEERSLLRQLAPQPEPDRAA